MDMLKKLAEDRMKKGQAPEEEQDPRKKSILLGILDHITQMAEDSMGHDLKQSMDDPEAQDDKHSGLDKGAEKAEMMVQIHGKPLHTDGYDEADDHDGEMSDHDALKDMAHSAQDSEEDDDQEEKPKYRK